MLRVPTRFGEKEESRNDGREKLDKLSLQIDSTVRKRFEDQVDRTVGLRDAAGKNCAKVLAIQKSLAKTQPEAWPPQQPILAKHMRALHGALDMTHSHKDRAMWCLALSCWLGMRRVGNFLSSDTEMKREFRPRFRSHRARYHLVHEDDGEDLLMRRFKPLKETSTGKMYQESVYRTGYEDDVLNRGNAWRAYLLGDQLPECTFLEKMPLFRDDVSGTEYSEGQFKAWIAEKFKLAGLQEFGTKTHSVRIGRQRPWQRWKVSARQREWEGG